MDACADIRERGKPLLREGRRLGGQMETTGLWFSVEMADAIGLSLAIVWMPEEKDFQISLLIGYLFLAIGYTFG